MYLCDADDCFNFRLFSYIVVDVLVAGNALLKILDAGLPVGLRLRLSARTCCKSLFSKVLALRLPIGECGIPLELRIILIFEFFAKFDFSSILTG